WRSKRDKLESRMGICLIVAAFGLAVMTLELQKGQEVSHKQVSNMDAAKRDSVKTEAQIQPKEQTNNIIIVDAGHGGDDPGKVGIHGEQEKVINLSIAKKLKEDLEKEKYTVIMTREDDNGLYDENATSHKVQDLQRRCKKIEDAKGALLVSVHQNSYPAESVKGAQVFYHGQSSGGKELAECLQKELIETLDKENKRQAKANESYYILKKTSIPAVIVECGFLSNPQEAALLSSEEYQKKVAEAICTGIQIYLGKK
ncbi:MAG: N-acetylmuramoyl-L-alanine amidase CwlD, partial [Lachnospiraceae bacterium]